MRASLQQAIGASPTPKFAGPLGVPPAEFAKSCDVFPLALPAAPGSRCCIIKSTQAFEMLADGTKRRLAYCKTISKLFASHADVAKWQTQRT